MLTRHSFRWFWLALTAAVLALLIVANTAKSQSTTNANVKTSEGMTVATFEVDSGRIRVYLPDDMRAGDTISGTVIAEPNGQTPEERTKNDAQLRLHGVLIFSSDPPPPKTPPIVLFDLSKGLGTAGVTETFVAPTKVTMIVIVGQSQLINNSQAYLPCPNEPCRPLSQLVFDVPYNRIIANNDPKIPPPTLDAIKLDPKTMVPPPAHVEAPLLDERKISSGQTTTEPTTTSRMIVPPLPELPMPFTLPRLGQTGRPIEITGPFDGNSSNTTLNGAAARINVQDFEKGTQNVSGGFGLIRPLAESPRKAVFRVPVNVTGPIEMNLKENNVETRGTFRNVGVKLSAPKTNLLRGEKTTLSVEVNGLEGIKDSVPLTLTYQGVITMEGGPYQPLMIQPSQVGADGRYTTTREITGVQPGGWGATATVITRPFDTCVQDDAVPLRRILWNTFTGNYAFSCPGCLPPRTQQGGTAGPTGTAGGSGGTKTGETAQTGGTTTTVTPNPPPGGNAGPPIPLTGTGTMARKGCIITLTHNAPDRRVFARLDACTNSASTTVESPPTDMKFSITDKNITDNACAAK